MRTLLYGQIFEHPIFIPNDIEANKVAYEAYHSAVTKLGLAQRRKWSDKDLAKLRSEARADASDLLDKMGTSRPPLSAVLHGVDRFVFMDKIVQSHVKDEQWFAKHPERQFRVRDPLPHESMGLFFDSGETNKVTTIVVRGRSGQGNTDPPRAVVCTIPKTLSLNSLDDRDLEKLIDCSNRSALFST
jgi:hypothetical protein